jgi:hypothetical protein
VGELQRHEGEQIWIWPVLLTLHSHRLLGLLRAEQQAHAESARGTQNAENHGGIDVVLALQKLIRAVSCIHPDHSPRTVHPMATQPEGFGQSQAGETESAGVVL